MNAVACEGECQLIFGAILHMLLGKQKEVLDQCLLRLACVGEALQSTPGRARTCDTGFRKAVLYPPELRGHRGTLGTGKDGTKRERSCSGGARVGCHENAPPWRCIGVAGAVQSRAFGGLADRT